MSDEKTSDLHPDKVRLDWLEKNCSRIWPYRNTLCVSAKVETATEFANLPSVREAIDAAMEKKSE